jgi:predicted phage terminase large subunit-like protein
MPKRFDPVGFAVGLYCEDLPQFAATAATEIATLPPPQPGPQEVFLNTEADIAIYGGAAGGGKTAALLLDFAAADRIANPLYGGVIFRRTSPMIRNEGGLWDESVKFYRDIGGEPVEGRLEWRMPSGATVRFAHLQHEKNAADWQGAQLARIGWDELSHFSSQQFFYLLSRARTTIGMTPQIRATTNPDADSWVAEFIDWWIGEDGFAIPERSGKIRWFVRNNGKIIWADTAEELQAADPEALPKSVTFIKASLDDNPILTKGDPSYRANLMAQHPTDLARLLEGNWKVRDEAGKVFERGWLPIVDQPELDAAAIANPTKITELRFWDLAATEKDIKGPDPCATAGVRIRRIGDVYYIMDVVEVFQSPGQTDQTLINTANRDGNWCKVRWEVEGGSSGKRDNIHILNLLRGYDAMGMAPDASKLARAKPLATAASHGNVRLLRGEWNAAFVNYATGFPDAKKGRDVIDAAAGAFGELSASKGVYREVRAAWGTR